jgi:hypothetical protein
VFAFIVETYLMTEDKIASSDEHFDELKKFLTELMGEVYRPHSMSEESTNSHL